MRLKILDWGLKNEGEIIGKTTVRDTLKARKSSGREMKC